MQLKQPEIDVVQLGAGDFRSVTILSGYLHDLIGYAVTLTKGRCGGKEEERRSE